MKRAIKTAASCLLASLLVLFLLPCGVALAEERVSDADAAYAENMDHIKDDLPDSVSKYLDEGDTREEAGVINAFLNVLNDLLGDLGSIVSGPLKLFGIMCAALVACAAYSFFTGHDPGLPSGNSVSLVGSLAISGAVSAVVADAIGAAAATIETADTFVDGFIPVFAGLMVSSGHVGSAAIFSGGMLAAASAASAVISGFVRPLAGVIMGLALVSGINDNEGMATLSGGLKKTVMWVLGIVTSLFVGLMGLQGLVSGQSDNMATRTTKYLVGSGIPIIGSSVSEAVATVSVSFRLIRATVGSAGIVALCGIFLPEIVRLILCAASMSLAAAVGDIIEVPRLSRAIRAVRGALDILTAVLSFYFVALAVCTAIMINAGG